MTSSAVAVPGVAVVDGVGLGAVETASCAIAMLAPKSSAVAVVKTFFIEIFEKWIFQVVMVIAFAIDAKTRESGAICRAFL